MRRASQNSRAVIPLPFLGSLLKIAPSTGTFRASKYVAQRLNESMASPTPGFPTMSTAALHATAMSAEEHPTMEPTEG